MSLTVAISTHEGYAHFLQKCVMSAAENADEVVVYDDGGTLEDICPPVARYVALPKSGYCIEARKRAIAEAECDWLQHLDGDDWLIRRPPEPDADVCFSDMYLCSESNDITDVWDCSWFPRDRATAMAFLEARRTNPVPGKSCYRVEWLREHDLSWYQWPHTTFGEDVRTIVEYLKHDPRIVYVPDAAYYVYRFHGTQDTRSEERRLEFLADLDAYLRG